MTSATINLITGIGGSGKTLFTLQHVEQLRKDSGRPVYYYGIPGIKDAGVLTEWIELAPFDKDDPALSKLPESVDLHAFPVGTIFVIDEFHRSFPNRSQKTAPPARVQNFDMSRHRGHTFFAMTQNPKDVDLFIRNRVGKHHHLIRTWGLERATRLEFDTVAEVPLKMKKDAFAHEFKFPKEVYSWYLSSDSHQIKKTVPWSKIAILFWGPVAVVGLLWYAWHKIHGFGGADKKPDGKGEQVHQLTPHEKSFDEIRRAALRRPMEQGPDWASKFVERVPGAPPSAAFYDAMFKAQAVPRVSGFMVITAADGTSKCTPLTQQGTVVTTVTNDQCLAMWRNGVFDPLKADDDGQGDRKQGRGGSSSGGPAEPMQSTASADRRAP